MEESELSISLPLVCVLSKDTSGDTYLVTAPVSQVDCLLVYPSREHAELYIEQASQHESDSTFEVLKLETDEALQHTLNQLPPNVAQGLFDAVVLKPEYFRLFDIDELRPQVVTEEFSQQRMEKALEVAGQIIDNWQKSNVLTYEVHAEDLLEGKSIEELQKMYFSVGVGGKRTELPFIDMLVCFSYIGGVDAARKTSRKGEKNPGRRISVKTSFSEYQARQLLSQIAITTP